MPEPPAMDQPVMDQQSFMQMVAQVCAEGWDRLAAGRNRAGDEEEEEGGWTGLQVAMTSVAVMMGAKALDLGGYGSWWPSKGPSIMNRKVRN